MSDSSTLGQQRETGATQPAADGTASILVAVDPPSPAPPTTVIETLALATGWPLVLVNAARQGSTAEELDDIGGRLADSTRTFTAHGIDARSVTLVGPPVDVILAEAEAVRAAMIVVVARRHDLDGRPLLDSVTSALLKVADRPVLVLPSGPRPSHPGYVAAVERLIDLIDRDDVDNAEQLAELRAAAIERLPEEPSTTDRSRIDRRLVDALHQFETDHPSLTAAINDVAYHLSGLGI